MKYSVKVVKIGENSGKYAVFTGKRYYPNTVTTNKLKAKQEALIMSMSFYQDQLDNAFSELEKICVKKNSIGELMLESNNGEYYTNKGDLLC